MKEMTDILVMHLRSIDQMSVEDCFCQSAYFIKAADRIDKLTAERDRLREAVTDALYAWDDHNKHGDPMQGWWVSDAHDALKGD